jgi:hypothetical protein
MANDEAWHKNLPDDVKGALHVDKESLGDFSETVERMEILARLATRRAVEGFAGDKYTQGEVVEMGNTIEPPDQKPATIEEKEQSLRFDVAVRANKELAKVKYLRLDAQKRHKQKAADVPERANIVFEVRHTSPERKIESLKRLKRYDEARALAKQHNIEYEEA